MFGGKEDIRSKDMPDTHTKKLLNHSSTYGKKLKNQLSTDATHKGREQTLTVDLCARYCAGDSHRLRSLILTEKQGLRLVPSYKWGRIGNVKKFAQGPTAIKSGNYHSNPLSVSIQTRVLPAMPCYLCFPEGMEGDNA